MTTKKTARKPKTFWAVRTCKVDTAQDERDYKYVSIFSTKPVGEIEEMWDGEVQWVTLAQDYGSLCYGHFLRVTGVKLEVGKPVEIAITARVV